MTDLISTERRLTLSAARNLSPHPFADLIPRPGAREFAALKQSLSETGQQLPIVLFAGRVLDGRNRLQALTELESPVNAVEFTGTEQQALLYALHTNTARRQLTESQRALLASRHRSRMSMTQAQVADAFAVSERLVRDADFLRNTVGAQARELERDVFEGRGTLKAAMRMLRGAAAMVRRRRTLIEPHPENAALESMPSEALDERMQRQVTRVTTAFAEGAVDAASWVHGLSAADATAMLPALDEFVRQAYALAIEEGLVPPPPPRTHGRTRAEAPQ